MALSEETPGEWGKFHTITWNDDDGGSGGGHGRDKDIDDVCCRG